MHTHYVLNGFCRAGKHDKCPRRSIGTRSDPHTYVCTCDCHKTESYPANVTRARPSNGGDDEHA